MKKILYILLFFCTITSQCPAWEINWKINNIAVGADNLKDKYKKCLKYTQRIRNDVNTLALVTTQVEANELEEKINEHNKKLKKCKEKQDKWYKKVGRAIANGGGEIGVGHNF